MLILLSALVSMSCSMFRSRAVLELENMHIHGSPVGWSQGNVGAHYSQQAVTRNATPTVLLGT
jgi:hypothetical protein